MRANHICVWCHILFWFTTCFAFNLNIKCYAIFTIHVHLQYALCWCGTRLPNILIIQFTTSTPYKTAQEGVRRCNKINDEDELKLLLFFPWLTEAIFRVKNHTLQHNISHGNCRSNLYDFTDLKRLRDQ